VNITQEQVAENHLKLVVNLDPEDYLVKVDEEIKSLSKKITMDGFRPGKVPQGLLKKKYGDAVLADELNKMISDSLTNYIKENELKVFGDPIPVAVKNNRIDVQRPEAYSFGFELGLMPDFDLPSLETKTFVKKVLKITDEMIEKEMDRLRSRFGEREYPEAATEEDILIGSFEELNEDGTVKEGGITSSSSFALKIIRDEIVKQQLMSLRKEEATDINIKAAFGNDEEMIIHHILHIDHHQAEHMNERFRFTVKNIVRINKAELNQEFFDKVYGAGNVMSEDEMRGKIKEELAKEYSRYSDSKLDRKIQEYLLSETKIDLPLDFLRRLMNNHREEDKPEINDEQFIEATNQIRWDLIFSRLSNTHQIKPTETEMKAEATKDIIKYFGGDASYFEQNPESLENIIASVLKDEKNASDIHTRIVNEKLFALLRSSVKIEEQEVDEHEFFHH
jgi:trigger factor